MSAASLAVLNANIITLDPKRPRAQAVAAYNGKIVAVGTNREIRKHISPATKVIDIHNKTVVPGLIDCHVHMTGFGRLLQSLELRNVSSIKEMQRRLLKFSEKHPEIDWILGGRWDHEKCSEKRLPNRWDLDEAVAEKPVLLTRVCGHIAVANSRALLLADITKRTVVNGGKIDLDDVSGEPNGILRENAMELVWKAIPKTLPDQLEKTCIVACKTAVTAGLTAVHWILGSLEEIKVLQKLSSSNKLPLRVYLGIPIDALDELVNLGLTTGFGNNKLKIGFVKILADGSLGARTAALKKPYSDEPETRGMTLYKQQELDQLVLKAHKAGLQLAIHAIGDHAIDITLKAYEKALNKSPRKNHRHRVEHCSLINPTLVKRMKRTGLIASVQPHFVISDFWTTDRLGQQRARWAYPFRTLMREGVLVTSGSDSPVEDISPILGIWAAVARGTFPKEAITAEQALRTYTINAAYASFDEEKKGTIEVGKFADLSILSDDPLSIQPDLIKEIKVEMTIVDGEVVYANRSFRQVSR